MQDVGRVGEEVRPEVLLLAGVGQLGDVLGQLPARVLPGEVGVGLAEADLGQMAHHRPPGERLGEEHHVGIDARGPRSISHAQNANGLVCGLSTRNTVTPQSTQCSTTSQQRVPQRPPVRRVPVDVVDVLVALGRVLGVLQRPVGAAVKPLGVLGQPRMIGRALDREVERDVDAVLGGGGGQRAQVLDSVPELGVDRVVAAAGVADRPRRAGVAGRRGQRVVAALAVGQPDRVDRRQVEDVEAELGQPRQLALDAAAGRPRSGGTARTRRRTGRAAGRPRAVSGCGSARRAVAVRVALDRRGQLVAERDVVLGGSGIARVVELGDRVLDQRRGRAGVAGCARRRPAAARRPRTARWRGRAWPPATLRASSSRQVPNSVGPGLDRVLPAPGRSTVNSPAQRTPPRWASIRSSSASPGGRRRARCGARPRAAARGRRGRCRRRPRRCRRRSA